MRVSRIFLCCSALVSAFCLSLTPALAQRTWTGGGADGNWFNSANWDGGTSIPLPGESVTLAGGVSVLLSNDTAQLNSFIITNATLVFTNWTTTLNATNVTVQDSGVFTLPVAFTNSPMMSNRVHVVCTSFVLDSGGSIDLNEHGYAGGRYDGNGPGHGLYQGNRGSGAGYGGAGGDSTWSTASQVGGTNYGDASAPVSPGSGGGSYGNASYRGGNGGGAVRINATDVTVDGSIAANGGNAGQWSGGGSGGGVYITCNTFGGTGGTISVDGGDGNGGGGGGSGGRIALDFNALSGTPTVTFSARPGTGPYDGWTHRDNPPFVRPATMGSLYMSKTNLLSSTIGNAFQSVRFSSPGFSSWAPSSLSISNSILQFEDGFNLSVTGAMLINSGGTLLMKGGADVSCGSLILDDGGLVVNVSSQFVCGSDMVLTNGGEFYIFSGATNGAATNYGAKVSIVGDMSIASGSWVYPYSHRTDGGSVMFRMDNLVIQSGGGFDADYKGYAGTNLVTGGFGPGGGLYHVNRGTGAGYGGKGGWSYWGSWLKLGGTNYGSSNACIQAGSGGGGSTGARYGTYGGGLIWIEAAGNVTVNGTLKANGNKGGYNAGGGSGGGIFVACNRFIGGSGALISTKGGNGGTSKQGGPGGGGRIAVATGLSAADLEKLKNDQSVTRLITYDVLSSFPGSISVIGGTNGPNYTGEEWRAPDDGTWRFVTTAYTVKIQGSPQDFYVPSPDDYGTTPYYADSAWMTNQVPSPGPASNGTRRVCQGWQLDDIEETPVDSGSGTQAMFQVTTNLVLTWIWTNEYQFAVSSGTNGTVSFGQNGWYTNGMTVVGITANPTSGYSFYEWTGDVPAGSETNNPLSLLMDQPRTIVGHFITDGGGTKIWTGSGIWASATNWSPQSMPGPADDVIIESGTVLLPESRVAGSVVVTNGATLSFTNWSTSLTVSNEVRIYGTVDASSSFASNQMSNVVSIVCSNFILESGASINVNEQGYKGGRWDGSGEGHGFYHPNRGSGAGYGGRSGDGTYYTVGGGTYGSASDPTQPGSGGGSYGNASFKGGDGGGLVRIVATNVTIDGNINANGGNGGNCSGGGSGGGIYIACSTFGGAGGSLTAIGGNGTSGSSGGGGGRIALHYGSLNGSPTVSFNAQRGTGIYNGWGESVTAPPRDPSEMGTLYLSKTNLLLSSMTDTFQYVKLIVPGFSQWSPATLAMNNCQLWLEDDFILNVAGSMTLQGGSVLLLKGNPSFSCGALTLDNSELLVNVSTQITCNGNATVINGGVWRIYSGTTNGTVEYGGLVDINGNVIIGASSWIHPYSDQTNGGSLLFQMGAMDIAETGGFDADGRGYHAFDPSNNDGWGEGHGFYHGNRGSGAGYGGKGGWGYWLAWLNDGGITYGDSNAPAQPGSGAGGSIGNRYGAHGGGLVWIEASGNLNVDGTIKAGGSSSTLEGGGGSGGGIYITCNKFDGGVNGVVSAIGGNAASGGGGGGGGRIAISYKKSGLLYQGTFSVTNGTGPVGDGDTTKYPVVGTLVLIERAALGSVITIR